ncbi:MAG TPA: cobamide remodeling phosphodiesterase CbiR [Desulfomicrobiaceae bacterium]|nr:cobamide remodeling phosphodiesterase CbiR [Desulfomicrobiaceae bacterium]
MSGSPLPCLKGVFPFRLSVPSFIIPADILPNVRFLGPHVDEIELLFFESFSEYYDCLPREETISELVKLGNDFAVRYNVHLPNDLYLGDADDAARHRDLEMMFRFYERTRPLTPSCHVLHLERCRPGSLAEPESVWLERCRESLGWMIERGLDPAGVAVENLEYPPTRVQHLVNSMGFRFCLDIGHLLLGGQDLDHTLRTCLSDTIMIHLHGVREGKDHRSLEHLGSESRAVLAEHLGEYRQGLSVEVFSLNTLQRSLPLMERFRR